MKRILLAFLLAGAALTGCATPSAGHHHTHPSSPATRKIEFPAAPGTGDPREVRVLIDEPSLKLASIVLRGGTVLPTHHSGVPVTIMALQGSGTVVAGTERYPLDPTHAVFLAPGTPHAVEPSAGTDLVLLVHHLGRAEEHHL